MIVSRCLQPKGYTSPAMTHMKVCKRSSRWKIYQTIW